MFSLILFFVCSIIYLQLSFKDFSSIHIKCFSWYFLQLKISLVLTLQMFSLILSPFKISLVLTLQMFFLNTLSFFSFWDKFKLKLLKIFSDTRINAFSDTLLHVDVLLAIIFWRLCYIDTLTFIYTTEQSCTWVICLFSNTSCA